MKRKSYLMLLVFFISIINSGINLTIVNASLDNILITEVFYDEPSSTYEEWIELYNPTANPISINGWKISDNAGTTTFGDITIPSGGYLIIAKDNDAFYNLYGFYPDLDSLTLSLNNDGDQLTLNDSSNNIVDFVAWNKGYSNAYLDWTVSAPENYTITRKADVDDDPIDTDSNDDWEQGGVKYGDPGDGYGGSGDSTAPSVTINTPQEGDVVAGTVTVSFEADDNSGSISSYSIEIDGSQISDTNSYSWDSTSVSDGFHTIRCNATDPSGNTGYSEITIKVDNRPNSVPIEVYFTDPLSGLPYMNHPELQEGNITDGLVGLIDSANESIQAALYHLDWQPVIDALIDANTTRGVNVDIACHGDNIDEFQELIDEGIAVHPVDTYNIMHNKFFIVDDWIVWTGSYNPTITGTIHNANDGIKITSPQLAQIYQKEFEQLFDGLFGTHKTDNNYEVTKAGDITVEAYFSPQDNGRDRLIELIDSANESIYISMFYLTDDTIYEAIVNAHNRGVTVKCVFDYRGWRNSYAEADDLIELGLGIIDANPGVYHHKFGVIDGKIVWTGSTNWSASGFEDNDENSVVIHDAGIAAHYIARTEEYYQDAVDYDSSPTEAPRIVTRHYSGWDGANFITWRPHMDGNVANDLIDKYLVWRWNPTTEDYDLIHEIDPASGYYADADVEENVTYYYVISSIAEGDYNMTTCSAEFAQIGAGGDQPVIYPVRDYYSNFGVESTDPIVHISNPADSETVSGWVDITLSVEDTSYISEWEVYIDGVLVSQDSSHFGWDTTSYSDGSHTILAKVKDNAGNWGERSITVTVDNSDYLAPLQPSFSEIKVMTYNIEASGENPAFLDVIKEENPDIFVLVEAGDLDDNGNESLNEILVELNEYFIHEYHYEMATTQGMGSKYTGISIFSRFPIVDENQIPIITLDDGTKYDVSHDFFEAIIEIGDGRVHIIGAHLKAQSGESNEIKREKAQEGILNYIDTLTEPVIYMGDLNSFSPEDTGDLAPNGDLGYGPVNMTINSDHLHAPVNYIFIDAFRTINPDDPGYSYPNAPYESRIDFILVSSFFDDKMLYSTCGDTPSAPNGSDHYSVDVTLNMTVWNSGDTTPPAKVLDVQASSISHEEINIWWSENSESDLSRYRIYRNDTFVTEVTTNYYNDSGLFDDTWYYYEVTAVDTSGNEGERSDPATAKTDEDPVQVLISEVYYDTIGIDADEEFIELYNNGSVVADLSGWSISDNYGTFTLPDNILLAPGDYLIIAQNDTGFYNLFGFYPTVSGMTLSLSNTGDLVRLKNDQGIEKDFVSWENYTIGWSIQANTSQSIQRNPVTVDTDTVADWTVNDPDPTPLPDTPVVTIVNPVDGSITNAEVTLIYQTSYGTTTIFLDDVLREDLSNNSKITGLSSGDHNLTIINQDVYGNSGQTTCIWTVDTTGPSITIASPLAMTYAEDTITIDLQGDAKYYWYFIEGLDTSNISWTNISQRTLSTGEYILHAYGNDSLGNQAHCSVTFSIDITPPTITILSPETTTYSTSYNVTISLTGEATNYWYYIEGVDFTNLSWSSTTERTLPNGNYTIHGFGNDTVGNVGHTSLWFVIDVSSPTVVIISPVDGNTTGNTVEFIFKESSIEGAYEIYLDNVLDSTLVNESIMTGLSTGQHNLTVVVTDKYGNQGTATSIWFVDSSPPEINSPSDITIEAGSTEIITWSVSDDNPDSYVITIDDTVTSQGSWIGLSEISVSIEDQSLGNHVVTIAISDLYGNNATDTVIVTVVDTTSPIISTSSQELTFRINDTSKSINWTVTDLNPGSYILYLDGEINKTGTWSSGEVLIFDINGLNVGIYNFTLVVVDSSGNSAYNTIRVAIVPANAPTPYANLSIIIGSLIVMVVFISKKRRS